MNELTMSGPLVFGVEDFRKILNAADKEFQTILLVTFSGHLRLGEAIGLNAGDFDAPTGLLSVSRSMSNAEGLKEVKNGTPKTVTLLDPGAEALTGHLRKRPRTPDEPMFTGPRGGRVKRSWVRSQWHAACKKAGIDDMHFHDIRHVSLTHLAHCGATPKEVMRRGGHKTFAAYIRYQSATDTRDGEIARAASKIFHIK